jgi:hypothetical protein
MQQRCDWWHGDALTGAPRVYDEANHAGEFVRDFSGRMC